jgi:hypothetical protein
LEDGCSKFLETKTPCFVSEADQTSLRDQRNGDTNPFRYPDLPRNTPTDSGVLEIYPTAALKSDLMYTETRFRPTPLDPLIGDLYNYSTVPGSSLSSPTMGSPHSIHGHQLPIPEWPIHGLGLNHYAGYDSFSPNDEYSFTPSGFEDFSLELSVKPNGFVDPSIIHPEYCTRLSAASECSDKYKPPAYPLSPALSRLSRSERQIKQGAQSPYLPSKYNTNSYPYPPPRRPSLGLLSSQDNFSGEEFREKGRCTYPDCGKIFKDIKAHMLTHMNERPEKCPIQTCDYHIKDFARKYDKNRHTLTHFKGTMVCGFCPGCGSMTEQSFNRADVFKRHLTSVHGVEQTPPNSRKKTSRNVNSSKQLSGYAPDATGKCSTCATTFSHAQDFYEHPDDCVLRIVLQEEPSEALHALGLAEVENERSMKETFCSNTLLSIAHDADLKDLEVDDDLDAMDEMDVGDDGDFSLRPRSTSNRETNSRNGLTNGAQKSRELTHLKGGVTLNTEGFKKRKHYPPSWSCPTSQLKMKNRVPCVFDEPRRLWKDDMMLETDYEVRMKLGDKTDVTDLDVQTIHRAEDLHNSTEEEKGSWTTDDLKGTDLEKPMTFKDEDGYVAVRHELLSRVYIGTATPRDQGLGLVPGISF